MGMRATAVWAGLGLLFAGGSLRGGEETGGHPWVCYPGGDGPGRGRHIVFITGDEEYRSEESMPQLARILAFRHGFRCTVLFAIDPADGTINPERNDHIPGLEALASADLMVIFTRFRDLPDEQMKYIVDYLKSGKPIVGLRTATHAFAFRRHSTWARYDWQSREPGFEGGFGRQVLGETWIDHYGQHQVESTRGIIAPGREDHPILRGVSDIWGPSDVYAITTLAGDCQPLVLGQVLTGMRPEDPPRTDRQLVPIAWTKTWIGPTGRKSRVFTTTMGHAGDLENEGVRRMLVNACYWALGMESAIGPRSEVGFVGPYRPTEIGFGKHRPGVRPADFAWPPAETRPCPASQPLP